ncbi:MAG: hypothetical protein NC299_04690 [Lachnospiraceae bacterium]|nr:hypothetical protein [Ruminococcus sp.]MCM1274647.1 hypothetical protein [Lachnospiraceae bacterium]
MKFMQVSNSSKNVKDFQKIGVFIGERENSVGQEQWVLFPADNREEINMKNFIRRISTAVLAATMTMSVLMTSASAYVSAGGWSVNYVNRLPGRPEGSDKVELDLFSGGYLTYCSNISGANNRSVLVKATGISEFMITAKGYSNIYKTISTSNDIYFNFYGRGSTTCVAGGTAGYNM